MEESRELESLFQVDGIYPPSEEYLSKCYIKDRNTLDEKAKDRDTFWANIAAELTWFKLWDRVLKWEPPFAKWFDGGKQGA